MNKNFNGYRTHQTYIERVNNFMLQVQRSGENENGDVVLENGEEMEDGEEVQQQQRSNIMQRLNPQQQQQYQRQQQMQQQRQQQQQQQQQRQPQRQGPLNTRQPQFKQLYPNQKLQQRNGNTYEQQYSSSSLNSEPMMMEETSMIEEQYQPQQQAPPQKAQKPTEKRKITTSDLRNKRSQIQNHSYSGYSNDNSKRTSYSVKMAIGSGGYQADSL